MSFLLAQSHRKAVNSLILGAASCTPANISRKDMELLLSYKSIYRIKNKREANKIHIYLT